jgi:hypothetical protein
MVDDGGTERGRLHVTVQPAFQTEDKAPALILTLVTRGAPIQEDEDGILQHLRLGHEWIVRGFTAVTTPEMHEQWERQT